MLQHVQKSARHLLNQWHPSRTSAAQYTSPARVATLQDELGFVATILMFVASILATITTSITLILILIITGTWLL